MMICSGIIILLSVVLSRISDNSNYSNKCLTIPRIISNESFYDVINKICEYIERSKYEVIICASKVENITTLNRILLSLGIAQSNGAKIRFITPYISHFKTNTVFLEMKRTASINFVISDSDVFGYFPLFLNASSFSMHQYIMSSDCSYLIDAFRKIGLETLEYVKGFRSRTQRIGESNGLYAFSNDIEGQFYQYNASFVFQKVPQCKNITFVVDQVPSPYLDELHYKVSVSSLILQYAQLGKNVTIQIPENGVFLENKWIQVLMAFQSISFIQYPTSYHPINSVLCDEASILFSHTLKGFVFENHFGIHLYIP